eukprot:gnl/Trimastix_PCT/1540.p1 GENE.gnl/Trimastix_PCT/1540~~gnl/Trimastix_PCT/1540.p1  ORF type:complete len:364 (-),score=52.89 gnl/Trimastix_PCT/1540:30-1121(-)
MNIPLQHSKNGILYIGFNQTASYLTVGTRAGFSIFRCYPFVQSVSGVNEGSIKLVEMLFASSLVAFVGTGEQPHFSSRMLYIWNTSLRRAICELNFRAPIVALRMNDQRLVIALSNKIHVYDLNCVQVLASYDILCTAGTPEARPAHLENQTLHVGAANPSEPARPPAESPEAARLATLVALAPEQNTLAYPCSATQGQIMVRHLDADEMPSRVVDAHNSPIAALTLNKEGTSLATASIKGTIIRIYNTSTGSKINEFRRGLSKTQIYSIAFSADSSLLCVTCGRGTIHIFATSSPMSSKSFCRIRAKGQCVASFSPDNQYLHVAFTDGFFRRYRLPQPGSGPNAELECEHSLVDATMQTVRP